MKRALLSFVIIVVINLTYTSQIFGHPNRSQPSLNSESAIVIDAKTSKVLYEKESLAQMYPASLTKIATAIYAIERGNIEDLVTVSKKARDTEGSKVYLEEGEQVTLKKLIQGLLINSGNDAGVAIAEHLSGSVKQFSSDINKYLKNVIGIKNTNYQNPHGLFNSNHVTTAADLAIITQYAMNNKLFKEIFGTRELDWDGESWDTTLITHHKLMRESPYEGITGGKTGFVNKSGFTLATTAERKNLSLIVITLNSNLSSEAYNDTVNLLDYVFENFQTSSIPKGTIFKFDKQKYKTIQEINYTHYLDGQVKKKIDADGTLEIINQNGTVIQSSPLKRINKEVNLANMQRMLVKKENRDLEIHLLVEKHFIKAAVFTLVLIFIATIFYQKSRKK